MLKVSFVGIPLYVVSQSRIQGPTWKQAPCDLVHEETQRNYYFGHVSHEHPLPYHQFLTNMYRSRVRLCNPHIISFLTQVKKPGLNLME